MTYGELGRTSIDIIIKTRMISFWNRLIMNNNKLSSILYRVMVSLSSTHQCNFKWINYIKSIFDNIGLSYIWANQLPYPPEVIKAFVKQKLTDEFIQSWFSQIEASSRGEFYGLFKTCFGLEKYLTKLSPNERENITKLRCCNVKIPVEVERWYGIPKEERICTLCAKHKGTEFHYLFVCDFELVKIIREKHIKEYYYKNSSLMKMKGLLFYCNIKILKNLSMFIQKLSKLL